MRTLIMAGALLLMAGLLTGCVNYRVPNYVGMTDSADKIAATEMQYRVNLVSAPANDKGSAMCRGANPVVIGEGLRYSDYLVDALSRDLKSARAYSEQASNVIQVALSRVEFQSSLGATNWYIFGTYTLGGESVTVETAYNDRSSFMGDRACNNIAKYFSDAVAEHLDELYSSHLFTSAGSAPVDASSQSLRGRLLELERVHSEGLITDGELEMGRKRAIEGR